MTPHAQLSFDISNSRLTHRLAFSLYMIANNAGIDAKTGEPIDGVSKEHAIYHANKWLSLEWENPQFYHEGDDIHKFGKAHWYNLACGIVKILLRTDGIDIDPNILASPGTDFWDIDQALVNRKK